MEKPVALDSCIPLCNLEKEIFALKNDIRILKYELSDLRTEIIN